MSHLLEVQGLCKRYGEVIVAQNIDFDLNLGECLGVIGPNGAGKTTLLHLLTGTVMADAGRIRLQGHDITYLPPHARVQNSHFGGGIARAFQVPQPFAALSTFENVLVAAQSGAGLSGKASQKWALAQLERTGLLGRANHLAGSLTLLDRKRLELAKALACQPRVLLLDEIAGGLTEAEVEVLIELILTLKPHYAMIWIEHIPHALKAVASRLMVLHFGSKVLEGEPEAVMASALVQEIYMGVQAHGAA